MLTRSASGFAIVVVTFVLSIAGAPPAQVQACAAAPAAPQTPSELTANDLRGRPYTRPARRDAAWARRKAGPDRLLAPFARSRQADWQPWQGRAQFCAAVQRSGTTCAAATARTTRSIRRRCASSAAYRVTTAAAFRSRSCTRRSGSRRSISTTRTGGYRSTRTCEHPENPEPRYFGHAIAHWDDVTLVIETTGLRDSARDRIWLDENGNPTSDQTRVTERWTRPDFHHLNLADDGVRPEVLHPPVHLHANVGAW